MLYYVKTLSSIHLEHPWSIETLAKQARMSRTAFTQHFHALVGQTPINDDAC